MPLHSLSCRFLWAFSHKWGMKESHTHTHTHKGFTSDNHHSIAWRWVGLSRVSRSCCCLRRVMQVCLCVRMQLLITMAYWLKSARKARRDKIQSLIVRQISSALSKVFKNRKEMLCWGEHKSAPPCTPTQEGPFFVFLLSFLSICFALKPCFFTLFKLSKGWKLGLSRLSLRLIVFSFVFVQKQLLR